MTEIKKDNNNSDQKSSDSDNQNSFQWKQAGKTSLIWVVILISAIFLSNLFTSKNRNEVEIQYFEYQKFLNAGAILEAEIIENEFHGKLKEPQDLIREGQKIGEYTNFLVTLPFVNESVLSEWDKFSVLYSFKERKVDWLSYLLSMAPWLLLIIFWIFIMRRMQGGVGGNSLFNFGRSRARLWVEDKPKINFDRVAGCQEAKQELSEIITF